MTNYGCRCAPSFLMLKYKMVVLLNSTLDIRHSHRLWTPAFAGVTEVELFASPKMVVIKKFELAKLELKIK